jgi:putative ABC transport system permease protein
MLRPALYFIHAVLAQNLRFGLRMLRKSPGFTGLALLTLALGIGANTTIFSVVNSVLLRPLPYKDPDRIVQLQDMIGSNAITSSFPKFSFLRDRAHSFSALAAISFATFQVNGPANAAPAEVTGLRVSSEFFRVLGVNMALGRAFSDEEDRPGGPAVAVISYALWQNRFASDPAVTGKTVALDGTPTTIVGVAPAGFRFPSETEIWIPKTFEHAIITRAQIQAGASYLLLYGRLAAGVAAMAAQAEVSALNQQYDVAHRGFGDTGRTVALVPLRESFVGDVRRILLVLLGAVGFVLLIATANVANLLLARAAARQKEVAVRAALGAGYARLLGQFLTESLLLAMMGAVAGVALSLVGARMIGRLSPNILPRAGEIKVDGAVLAFTAGIAVLAGVLFGLGPALHAMRVDLNEALKATSRGIARASGLRGFMIAAEVALATILLTGAGLLMRSFLNLESVDPGFRPDNLVVMRIGLAPARYPQPAQQSEFYHRVLEKVAATAGVHDVALANALPTRGRAIGYFFNIEGRPPLEPAKAPTAWLQSISPGYFHAMGIPLLAGRGFTDSDDAAAPLVAIINQNMARRHWPNEDPLGRVIVYSRERLRLKIVGVCANVKAGGLGDASRDDLMYVPYRQRPYLAMWVVARGPSSIANAMRTDVAAIDPEQPVTAIQSMQAFISDSVSQPRLRTALIGSFAALALILAMIGIAGVVAWSVSQRTNEIGVRMALGASRMNVMSMVVQQSFVMIAAGQVVGVAGALALTRVLSNFLFGVTAEDPLTFAAVVGAMAVAALSTCVLAARRALQVDPVIALRAE